LNKVYLLLGSNVGNRKEMLEKAKMNLGSIGHIISVSSVYETKAWGKSDQPDFLNQVILLETQLTAEELLKNIMEVEIKLGRVREQKWAERTIDIDILFFNEEIVVTKTLKIPHPEISKRKFTLVPLNEIAPDLLHPVLNLTATQMLERCEDSLEVKKFLTAKSE
jgi:2-amino-4-hydroxy-6-hydroxymethyldihydropteridine diphosphokinase